MGKILINLDVTELGNLVRNHPDYAREVTFKDGSKKKFVNLVVSEMKEQDKNGNDYSVYAYKSKDHKDDETIWLGKGKLMMPKEGGTSAPTDSGVGVSAGSGEDLPFE